LAFRIGVTGARELPIGSRDDLLRQVRDVLRLVRDEIVQGAATPAIGTAYGETAPVLRLVSPLAEGADRLVARAALDEGYALVVPMPFAQAEYEKDFAGGESVGEFRDLLARATSRLELDGGRGEDEAASYEAVGRLVVRNCDLLIALWDGRPGKGRGGTAETVRFAANGGPPIWWARPDAAVAPRWIVDTADLSLSATQPGATAAALKDYLKLTMRPPEHSVPAPELLFERLGDLAEGRRGSPQSTYFAEQKLHRPWYWKAHAGLMRLASGKLLSAWIPPPPPAGPTALYWHGCYGPADARSGDYGARYRSVYTWVLLLGALALIAAAVSVAIHDVKAPAALIELVLLLAIAGLVWANHARRWHPRWIEYRLLAELCRKQQALALLGLVAAALDARYAGAIGARRRCDRREIADLGRLALPGLCPRRADGGRPLFGRSARCRPGPRARRSDPGPAPLSRGSRAPISPRGASFRALGRGAVLPCPGADLREARAAHVFRRG
jgi:hypothetical protein